MPVSTAPFPTTANKTAPGRALCDQHSSFSYIFTEDGSRAYQALYEKSANPAVWDSNHGSRANPVGTTSSRFGPFGDFWHTVTKRFGGMCGVLGGELWNEPFPGAVFDEPEIYRDNHQADKRNLQPWYANQI